MNIGIRSIIVILIVGIIVIPAIAYTQPSGTPFDAIWNEINNIKSTIANLQDQINHIQLIPGPKGDKGDRGEPGLQGSSGISGYEVVHTDWIHMYTGIKNEIFIACPNGKVPLGGGFENQEPYDYTNVDVDIHILKNIPKDVIVGSEYQRGWFFEVYTPHSYLQDVRAYVICTNVQ